MQKNLTLMLVDPSYIACFCVFLCSFLFSSFCSVSDQKSCLSVKKWILTKEQHAEHLFAVWNTQRIPISVCEWDLCGQLFSLECLKENGSETENKFVRRVGCMFIWHSIYWSSTKFFFNNRSLEPGLNLFCYTWEL